MNRSVLALAASLARARARGLSSAPRRRHGGPHGLGAGHTRCRSRIRWRPSRPAGHRRTASADRRRAGHERRHRRRRPAACGSAPVARRPLVPRRRLDRRDGRGRDLPDTALQRAGARSLPRLGLRLRRRLARVNAWDYRKEVYLYQSGGTVAARLRGGGSSLSRASSPNRAPADPVALKHSQGKPQRSRRPARARALVRHRPNSAGAAAGGVAIALDRCRP